MNTLNDKKRQYNELLMLYFKMEAFMDDESVRLEEKEKHIERLRKLIQGLNRLLGEIGKHTADEVVNGFQYIP